MKARGERKVSGSEWDERIDYLRNTRWMLYNEDYLEFLARKVWAIDRPVRLIDFGCGYGFMGLALLPLLPEGSTYTGIDAGTKLIAEARRVFRELPYPSAFIEGDLLEVPLERQYDMAVSHAVVMHMEQPNSMLQRMIDCVVPGGRVACFESHWIANAANQHVDGHEQSDLVQLGALQRLYEADARRTGKDGNIGMKLPILMSKLGLQHVACRVSDRVNFLNPHEEPEIRNQLLQSLGFGHPGDREAYAAGLIARGLTPEEASLMYEDELFFAERLDADTFMTYAPNMKISYGIVAKESGL
ncbi:SAM-dependent methyltransferase [Paenibacillus phyllosphaerae]|uniref:SAM-dependent methyltransferase n=1 Tax=Paenibacillus phyllosphaerae TaxID=274593 RepID=A0A7W5AXU2_9BACL|nr:methyltransferase domain-containing protein [Paenibacillus phyllosphaerae]MBB3110266.1 SAM-dependent methyltransferase [Paenibacillus phyllosphaerae]